MSTRTLTYKIYELDINDSLLLLVDELLVSGLAPMNISYRGDEDGHTVWKVEYHDAE